MSGKLPPKDDALEALDFIINVLREHEKDLDKLVNELGKIVEKLGGVGELDGRIQNIEKRLTGIQTEVAKLISYLSASPRTTHPASPPTLATKTAPQGQKPIIEISGTLIRLRCNQWEDFQGLARQAQTISFTYKEAENKVQVDALKNNQIITYIGESPRHTLLLKTWLSKQLEVPEDKILEGTLTTG
ncbi:hypothetical protein H5T51_01205 [Candidatus Bathyarchaeota archaeon]|nr:hypothetical protein [Candidatus Bathyarchaeota archaeon]